MHTPTHRCICRNHFQRHLHFVSISHCVLNFPVSNTFLITSIFQPGFELLSSISSGGACLKEDFSSDLLTGNVRSHPTGRSLECSGKNSNNDSSTPGSHRVFQTSPEDRDAPLLQLPGKYSPAAMRRTVLRVR